MIKFEKKLEDQLTELSSHGVYEHGELSMFAQGAKWCLNEMEEDFSDRFLVYIAKLHETLQKK